HDHLDHEEAMRDTVVSILLSPEFCYRVDLPAAPAVASARRAGPDARSLPDTRKTPLGDYALASRLSYFLWSSMPDDELLSQAAAKKLTQSDALRAQVELMLKDEKSRAFVQNFTGQWLDLRNIDATTPDKKLYPEADELLIVSMVQETEEFFAELLKHNLSVTNIIQSDFAMLNCRLAIHYGIDGVRGEEFRKVPLPPD